MKKLRRIIIIEVRKFFLCVLILIMTLMRVKFENDNTQLPTHLFNPRHGLINHT